MAFFGVTVEKIKTVGPIPKADRIQVASLDGMDFQFVIMKDEFKPGDKVLYFPVDSLIPEVHLQKMGLSGKLSGSKRNRVKTVKMRGQISQGLVAQMGLVPPDVSERANAEEITKVLGVEKYVPVEIACKDAKLLPLPDGVSSYDIEGADRYMSVAELLMDQPVMITEKVEGSNFSVMATANWERDEANACWVAKEAKTFVNQHNKTIVPIEGVEHTWWKVAKEKRLLDMAIALCMQERKTAVIFGEMLGPGIQGNIYGLKEFTVRLFDIRIGGEWMDPEAFIKLVSSWYQCRAETPPCEKCNPGPMEDPMIVPILSRGKTLREWLAGKSIKDASNGKSVAFPSYEGKREGIVIRPMKEQFAPFKKADGTESSERLILKQRSASYLVGNDL